eukprot:GFUD01058103.1.p1 GENE.GFUD01058103.1~~GFUD01058103.1.p1  ORF type:complete len:390 (-),score=108.11 GFUD01058103.1:103-1272(-)
MMFQKAILVLFFLSCGSCDPVEELSQMEEIMMKSFPFAMMLNKRVEPEALAHRVAKVFGVKYVPSKLNSIGSHNKVKTARQGKQIVDEVELLGIIDAIIPKPLAQRVAIDAKLIKEQENHIFNIGDIAKSKPNRDGKKCIEKVEMVEETEYEDVVTCDHSYDRRCHTTYATTYVAQQVEECDEDYKKECFIQFDQVAVNETVTVCRRPLVKDCNEKGPEICLTKYESECWTVQEHKQVEDDVPHCETVYEELCTEQTDGYTATEVCDTWPKEVCSVSKKENGKVKPITSCRLVPTEICAPASCGVKEGEEECYDKTITLIEENPYETCTLDPQRQCKFVAELVPHIKPVELCADVPKEVCNRIKTNPRKVKKPVVKKWCYVPTLESGLV